MFCSSYLPLSEGGAARSAAGGLFNHSNDSYAKVSFPRRGGCAIQYVPVLLIEAARNRACAARSGADGREARARQGEGVISVSNFNKKGALRGSCITTPTSRSNDMVRSVP